MAVAISVLALLTSMGAALIAWRAFDQARDAKQIALIGQSGQQADGGGPVAQPTVGGIPIDPAPSDGPAGLPPDPGSSTPAERPPLNERTVYTVEYESQTLTLKNVRNLRMYVDLDEPRANVGQNQHDLALAARAGTDQGYLALGDDVQGSEAVTPSSTPYDCAEKIRTAPLGSATVAVRQGAVICLMTSYSAARSRGDVQRIVLLEVTGVSADNAVTIRATAWNIPG